MLKLSLLVALFSIAALADTLPPGAVVLKDTSGNKVGTTTAGAATGENVFVINPGGSSTVLSNQGSPNTAANAWPVAPCNALTGHCLSVAADGSILVTQDTSPWVISGSVGRTWTLLHSSDTVGSWTLDGSGNPIGSTSSALNVFLTNSSIAVTGTVAVSNPSTNYALETGGHLASLDTKLPSQGQALAAASLPVVLPATQITTLTPPTTVTVIQPTGSNLHAVLDTTSTTAVTQATAANLNATVVQASGANLHTNVDNFPATQNVAVTNTPTVTANAGTNLNTSALALSANQTNGTQQTEINNGANIAAVKAASTAAVATDPALVVAVSPNNSVAVTQATAANLNVTVVGTVTANAGTNLNTSALATSANQTSQITQETSTATNTTGLNNTVATPGSAVPSKALQMAGTDGTNARVPLVDANNITQVSLGNSGGKSTVMKTGTLVTTAVTANQVVLTYTVTAAKTFYVQYFDCSSILTGATATSTFFGTCSLSINGTIVYTQQYKGAGVATNDSPHDFAEPIPVPAGQIILYEVTPAAVTSFTWVANFGGYEK